MTKDSTNWKRFPFLTSLVAVLFGVAAKLSLTKGDLLPGLDGAFYWVQVRSLLSHGSLAFPDLPLVFWVQAAIAKMVGDVQLGVRISDAVLPALSAIPIYLITRRYKNQFLPALAILVVLLHPIQLYFFTGDFIKNEASIPVVFFIALVLLNWDSYSKRFSIISLISLLIIVSLSHFGTALLAFSFISLWGLLQMRSRGMKFWIKGLAVLAVAFIVLLGNFALIVPTRFSRLSSFLTNPGAIFENSVLDSFMQGYSDPIGFSIICGQIAAVALGIILWFIRGKLSHSDISMITSALFNAFILSSPFISAEWAYRLTGLSFAPLAIAAILIFGNANLVFHKAPVALLAGAVLIASVAFMSNEMKFVFSDEKYSDFKELVQQTEIPNNSVIVARHGVQYLCAWHFKTDVVLENYYETADLSAYSAVFILEENRFKDDKKAESNLEPKDKDRNSKKPPLVGEKKSKGSDKVINLNPSEGVSGDETFILTRIR